MPKRMQDRNDRPEVLFSRSTVALYLVPADQPHHRAGDLIIELSRDPSLHDLDPNVRKLRHLADAWKS